MPELELEADEATAEGFIEENPEGAFARFREVLGALFKVPKAELDEQIAKRRGKARASREAP